LYKTEEFDKNNSSLDSIINPYRKKVALEMNVVIGEVETNLKKEQPESNIGNWACDALAEQTAIYTNTTVDFAILNYGGLRIGSIAQGEINKGKIFELMPFDNSVVIIEMPGKELDSLFTHMAIKGGWPVSADLKIVADKSGHVKTVKIKNQAIDPEKTYHIASIDYLANGGDNCSFFIGKKQIQTDVLLREAIIDNVDKKHKAGKKINAVKEGRFIVE
jgi:2',3'-cyclic-nucleotide 2'-phosphodiesterase (5'-nucleotidase family)